MWMEVNTHSWDQNFLESELPPIALRLALCPILFGRRYARQAITPWWIAIPSIHGALNGFISWKSLRLQVAHIQVRIEKYDAELSCCYERKMGCNDSLCRASEGFGISWLIALLVSCILWIRSTLMTYQGVWWIVDAPTHHRSNIKTYKISMSLCHISQNTDLVNIENSAWTNNHPQSVLFR